MTLTAERKRVLDRIGASVDSLGTPIPELPSDPSTGVFYTLTGSGHSDLNPTILHVRVDTQGSAVRVLIRAVAKEGIVAQHSARKAVERFQEIVRGLA